MRRFIAQAAHLAETHLGESGLDYGEQQHGIAAWLDLDFDVIIAGVGFTKQALVTLAKDPGAHAVHCLCVFDGRSLRTAVVLEPEDADLTRAMYEPLQLLIDQARTAQSIARKILRRVGDLVKNSAYLVPATAEPLADVSRSMQLLSGAAVKVR